MYLGKETTTGNRHLGNKERSASFPRNVSPTLLHLKTEQNLKSSVEF